jgi:hypothetical protein
MPTSMARFLRCRGFALRRLPLVLALLPTYYLSELCHRIYSPFVRRCLEPGYYPALFNPQTGLSLSLTVRVWHRLLL